MSKIIELKGNNKMGNGIGGKKKLLPILTAVVLIGSLLTGCGSKAKVSSGSKFMGVASATVRFKVGTTTAPDGHYVKGLQEMQKLLEKYSDGEMTLDIYPNSELGNERDMIESVGLGIQEMALVSTGPFPNFCPNWSVLDLPYLFEDAQEAYRKLDGENGQALLEELSKIRIKGIGFWENGFRQLTNDSVEVCKPEDVNGIKVRTMENTIHMATYQELGASPTPMAWSEIFTALQQGTVDGQENPIAIIDSAKVYEVQRYCSMINLFYSPCVLIINEKLYDNFTPKQKDAFDRAAEEAKTWQREYSQLYNEEGLKHMQEQGVTIIEVNQEEWIEAAQGVYGDVEKFGLSQELVDAWTED